MKSMDAYQGEVMRTAGGANLGILALGIAGEAGEVAELVKKHLGHGHALDADRLADELGDVLWYIAAMAEALDRDLSEIAAQNIKKLTARYPSGFDPERSKARGGK